MEDGNLVNSLNIHTHLNQLTTLPNNGWIKYISYDNIIIGYDDDVDRGTISWRKSSSNELMGAAIMHHITNNILNCTIIGKGEYWQSDDYIVPFIPNRSMSGKRIIRRISRLISRSDTGLAIDRINNQLSILVNKRNAVNTVILTEDHAGLWIVAEIDIVNGAVGWRFSKSPI
jgi:hypothetical protein